MDIIWETFVDTYPRQKDETDKQYLERFYNYLTKERGFRCHV